MDMEFLIPVVIMGFFVYVIKTISDNRLRHKIIERGQLDESIKYLFMDRDQNRRLITLKWGLVLIAIGLAFIIGQAFGKEIAETMTVGFILLFAGIGFFVYYYLAYNNSSDLPEKQISVE